MQRLMAGTKNSSATVGAKVQLGALQQAGGDLFSNEAGSATLNALQNMDPAQFNKIQSDIETARRTGDRSKLDQTLSLMNLRTLKAAPLGKLSNVVNVGKEQSVIKSMIDMSPNAIGIKYSEDALKIMRGQGDQVSDQVKDIIGSWTGLNPETLNAFSGKAGIADRETARKKMTAGESAVIQMRKAKGTQEVSEMMEGGKNVNGEYSGDKNLQDFAKATEYLANKITDIKNETQKAALDFEPIKGSFKNFEEDTKRFGKSVEVFSKAIDSLNKQSSKADVQLPNPVISRPYQAQTQQLGYNIGSWLNNAFSSNDTKDSKK
jgi:hypothetical protein